MGDPAAVARIRVAIADDQELIRSALGAMIEAHDDLDLVLEASDGAELLDAMRAHRVDVVLMDIRMPRVDGIVATERLVRKDTGARILVLTTYDLDEYVFAAIRAGASGFLTKDASSDELAAAIRAVRAGDAVIAPRATASLIDFVARVPEPVDTGRLLAPFTPREREVLMLLMTGASNESIAEQLYMTGNTVKTHIKAILSKLELPDRLHVVIWGFENGIGGQERRPDRIRNPRE